MLSSFEGQTSVGIYSLAARLTQFLEVFVVAVMVSVFPLLSRYYKTEEKKFQAVWRFSCKYLMAAITLVCLMVYCAARPLVVAIGGEEFVEAAVALQILIWSQIFVYARIMCANLFVAVDEQRVMLTLTSIAVAANVVLDLLLIPRWGFVGACWGTLISYSLIFPVAYYLEGSRRYVKVLIRSWLRPGLALLSAVGVLLWIDGSVMVNVAAVSFVYCLVLLLTRTVRKEDLQLIKEIF